MNGYSFKVQERPPDFNVTQKEKFTDMITGFTNEVKYKKISLFKF